MDLVVERPPPPPVWTVLQSTVLRVPYTATHISYDTLTLTSYFLLSTFYVLISTFYFSTFRHLNNNFIVIV